MKNLKEKFALAQHIAHSHGILKLSDGSPASLPFTLLPSPFPKASLLFAKSIQRDFNLLFHKVAFDYPFLNSLMSQVIEVDPYIQRLWNILLLVNSEKCQQRIVLGLNRSDYMLHQDRNLTAEQTHLIESRLRRTQTAATFPVDDNKSDDLSGLSLQQVEFNLMASSFCGLAQRMVAVHRLTLSLFDLDSDQLQRVPECNSADNFADAIAIARRLYLAPDSEFLPGVVPEPSSCRSGAVLMIVPQNESNVYDQMALLSSLLTRHPQIPVLVRTFDDLVQHSGRLKLDEELRLFVDEQEVAIVYFRYGYTPEHFPDEEIWDVKYQLERSMAIKCPCIQYMLANTKLVQAALSKPAILSRFLDPNSDSFKRILSTFAKQYTLSDVFGLSDTEEIDRIIQACQNDPHRYVLKPQREGGGNNYFDEELIERLRQIMARGDSRSYVIMERFYPYVVENYLIHPQKPPGPHLMVSELGIFGAFVARGDTVYLNEHAGHLLRTKLAEFTEGGIAAGYGCLDSPFLT